MSTHDVRPDRRRNAAPAPPTGAARFAASESLPRSGGPSRWASVGALVVLLALVVGVPLAMVALDGVPQLPTGLPTREQLTGTLGIEQVLAVLVWVVWLAWLQFTICVAVEVRSAVAGIGLPARVPLAGPSQRFARTLVATALLLVLGAGQATALAPAASVAPAPAPVAVTAVATPGAEAAPVAEAATPAPVTAQADVTYHLGDLVLDAEEGAALAGKRVYVVQPPDGRYHDNLWDIAERTLNDGRRYQEVFELNKGRSQPDGQELSLARLIQPQWLLIMPEDAVDVPRVEVVAAPVTPAPPAETPAPAEAPAPVDAPVQAADGPVVEASSESSTRNLLLGTGLLAAGLIAAVEGLRRRRRTPEPSEAAVEVEVALRVGADPGRAQRLDQGLRALAAASRSAGHPLPAVYAAVVDDAALTLHLAPPRHDAPAPWVAAEDGRTWRLPAQATVAAQRRTPAPFPGLVSVGRDDSGADVLVDLEAAQGPVTVVGDEEKAREVVCALAAELATNRWSDALRVTGVGLPDALARLDETRYRHLDDVADALPDLAGRRADVLGTDVLTGRLQGGGAHGAWVPEYLVLGAAPTGVLADELLRITAGDRRAPLGLVVAGDLPGARWQFVVDAEGTLTLDLLELTVRANRLTPAQVAAVAELLTAEPTPEVEPGDAVQHEDHGPRPEPPAPARALDVADLTSAGVRVRVLGAPLVEAPHPLAEDRLALSTELVVHLALHRDGVHPTVLAAALWPAGVTAAVRDATIERTRAWLGADDDGRPHLRTRPDGRLVLGPHVVLDWDVALSLLVRARGQSDRDAEKRDLRAALRLAQGGVLARRPAGRYAWLARVRLERLARDLLVDAAHRLAVLCSYDDDPAGARAASWSGLTVAPADELLWRDMLRTAAATDGTEGVRAVASDLEATLASVGVSEPDPQTRALLEELLPGSTAGPRAGTA